MHSGGKWGGDYLVVGKEDYVSTKTERDIHIQRVKEVTPENTLIMAASLRAFSRDEGRRGTCAEEALDIISPGTDGAPGNPREDEYAVDQIEDPPPKDVWEIRGQRLVRIHNTPRKHLFSPREAADDPPPWKLYDIDVMRQTKTNSDMSDEKEIDDIWYGDQENDAYHKLGQEKPLLTKSHRHANQDILGLEIG